MSLMTTVPELQSPHLLLREIAAKDSRQIAAFMLQPQYQRHIAMRLTTVAEVEDFVARSVARQGDDRRRVFHLAAEERRTGDVIGDGFIIIQNDGTIEIGWGVHPDLWAMGLGKEIGRMVLAMSFEHLHAQAVFCKIMVANPASAKLARSIGMAFSNAVPDYPAGGGRFESIEIYRMTSSTYFNLPY
jgi:[ribosomal protein S5]-alanine N-acetyltransferase